MLLLMRGRYHPSMKQWKRSRRADSLKLSGRASKYLLFTGFLSSVRGMLPININPHSDVNSLSPMVALPCSRYGTLQFCWFLEYDSLYFIKSAEIMIFQNTGLIFSPVIEEFSSSNFTTTNKPTVFTDIVKYV